MGYGRFVIEIRGVVPVTADPAARKSPGMQRQVELGSPGILRQQFRGQTRDQFETLAVTLLVVVEHLEQRVMTQAALGLQVVDQMFERQGLMRLCLLRYGALAGKHYRKRFATVQGTAQDLGVDEETDQPFQFGPFAAGYGHAHTQVGLTTQTMQQHFVGREHDGEERGSLAKGQGIQGFRQPVTQGKVVPPTPERLLRRPGSVCG
ncbi:hypothetical protein RE428_35900 [Marinobacter nanhaiticus D15-8W]|nr:hypothetical protein RE428_35900 [Marinobacter nanhaiticus D15-8W]